MTIHSANLNVSKSFYSRIAVLSTVHEFTSHHACFIEEDDEQYAIRISGLADNESEDVIILHFTQLLHDYELRQEIEKTTGKLRDVIVAAAFSQIVMTEPHEDKP